MAEYATRSDIEDRYGVDNVSKWADLDDDQDPTKITNRIQRALVATTAFVDDMLRGGLHVIPFGTPPTSIVDVTASLAGVWLYDARGVADFNPETGESQNRLSVQKKNALDLLERMKTGGVLLDVDVNVMTPEAV